MSETKTEKPILMIELPENEMVAVMIRAFFEGVPDDIEADEVIANTHPHFVICARQAVRGMMLHWAAKIRDAGLAKPVAERAIDAAGLAQVGKPEALS